MRKIFKLCTKRMNARLQYDITPNYKNTHTHKSKHISEKINRKKNLLLIFLENCKLLRVNGDNY
jgi:hypothetical protein